MAQEKPRRWLQPQESWMPAIELSIKRAANHIAIAQGALDRAEMFRSQIAVRMLEKKDIARGRFCAEIHLRAAIR